MTFQPNPIDWTPPDGLGYSTARPVQLAGIGRLLVGIAVLFLLGGPALGWYVSNQIQLDKERERLFSEDGVDATATIVRVWRESNKEGTHMVSYRFLVDGREIIGNSKMYRNVWAGLHIGDAMPIRYLPSQPEVNRPAQRRPGPPSDWAPWAIPLLFIWLPFFFWFMIRRQARLLAEGRPALATITKIRRAKHTIVYYEFPLLDGQVIKGRSPVNRRNMPQPGEEACVLYMPENPRRNALYPFELVKLQR